MLIKGRKMLAKTDGEFNEQGKNNGHSVSLEQQISN